MDVYRHARGLMIFAVTLIVAACSPESGVALISTTVSAAQPDSRHSFIQQGWRPGTMEVRVVINQAGEQIENSLASGGTHTLVQWEFNLEAQVLLDVLVAPDLSVLLPDTQLDAPSDQALRTAFASSPIYKDSASVAPTGRAAYTKRLLVSSPNANEYSGLSEFMEGSGSIDHLTITNLRPSYFGAGYELELSLGYRMMLKSAKTAKPTKGEGSYFEEENVVYEDVLMYLFPKSDRALLESYPFAPSAGPQGSQRLFALDILKSLEDVEAGLTLVGELRPGMEWSGTKDQLTLSYSLADSAQRPFFRDIAGMTTRINPNRVQVDVLIKAR